MWPLELGLGTHNPRFVAWPLELGLGTHNPRFVVWPLELGVRDSQSTLELRWCHRHIFVVNSDDKEGLHCFVYAFNCRVRLELFTIWVWDPLSSTHLIRPFLLALKKLSLTTKYRALGFQTDGWSCGFQSLNIAKLVVEHRGIFSNVPLVPILPVLWTMCSVLLMLIVLCGSFKHPVMMWRV